LLAESNWSTQFCTNRPGLSTTKPGALARAFVCSAVVPSQGGRAQLRGRLIVRSGCLQLWSELPALAPGARCQWGRSAGSGAPGAVQWTATASHARNVRDPSRVLEQGPDRQRTPDWCSGGVSSINGASESRCRHNGPAGWNGHGRRRLGHRSSPEATALHEGDFMGGSLRGCLHPPPCRTYRATAWPGEKTTGRNTHTADAPPPSSDGMRAPHSRTLAARSLR